MQFGKIFLLSIQLIMLLLLNELGVFLVKITQLPLPGNVVGMLLLFLLLWARVIRLEWIEDVSSLLIKHLSFFFIPISVGLMTLGSLFLKSGLALLTILVISTLLGIIVSGALSQFLVKRKEAVRIERDHYDF